MLFELNSARDRNSVALQPTYLIEMTANVKRKKINRESIDGVDLSRVEVQTGVEKSARCLIVGRMMLHRS